MNIALFMLFENAQDGQRPVYYIAKNSQSKSKYFEEFKYPSMDLLLLFTLIKSTQKRIY